MLYLIDLPNAVSERRIQMLGRHLAMLMAFSILRIIIASLIFDYKSRCVRIGI
jgi:hypothetical protein